MTALEAISTCYRKYFTFCGRASRAEFWWFALFVSVAVILLRLFDLWIFGVDTSTGRSIHFLSQLFVLLNVLPMLAAGWRRMHDTGRPGWYILAPWIMSIAFILLSLGGIGLFSLIEHRQDLMNAAYFLGATAAVSGIIAYAALMIWIVWCLTRPGRHN